MKNLFPCWSRPDRATETPCLKISIQLATASLLACAAAGAAEAKLKLETVLPPITVEDNASAFATPLAYGDGAVYTANVEPNPDGRTGLRTVVRRGTRDEGGDWRWHSNVVENDTVRDPYHTLPSIGVDRLGYVHVAYDMHNVPWQYAVSTQPRSIDNFEFRGQQASLEQRKASKQNNVDFPGPGKADIPGNQITYPAFFNDRRGRLYVTYRYAVKPKADWKKRIFAGAIARYKAEDRSWQQLGGEVKRSGGDVALSNGAESDSTRPFAMERGSVVYHVRLAFDRNNGMHASWLWRDGRAGGDSTRPSYAYSPPGSEHFYRSNGDAYELPVGLEQAEKINANASNLASRSFNNTARITATPSGEPLVSVQTLDGQRYNFSRSANDNWQPPEKPPYQATQLRYDDQGNEWAFASGLAVLKRPVDNDGQPQGEWREAFLGGDLCKPQVVRESDDAFFIQGNVQSDGRCRKDRVKIVRLSGFSD